MPFSGIQDGNGKYLIRIPTWSPKVLYNAGTRIYYNNNYQFPDRLEIDGPTNMTLKIVVGNFIVTCANYDCRDGGRADGVWVSGNGSGNGSVCNLPLF